MMLDDVQIDALREMVNIGVGQAAGVLNAMLRAHVRLSVPVVEVLSTCELTTKLAAANKGETVSAVRLGFRGPFAGNASLVFPPESAANLIVLLTENDAASLDLDEIRIGTLTEVGNIVLNGVMGAIGNELKLRILYTLPTYVENPVDALLTGDSIDPVAAVVWISTVFTVEEHRINGEIILVLEVGSMDLLLAAIERQMQVAI